MYRKFASISLVLCVATTVMAEETAIRFASDWKWEGQAAPLLMALDEGYFTQEKLAVTLEPGKGSLEAIPRVASGDYQMGSADINSLIKYRDQNPDIDLRAVFVMYNSPPFAVIGRRSQGVIGPGDLQGRTLGAPSADGAFAQWPAFALANGIQTDKVTIKDVGFPDREPSLANGEVDAITGFSFSSVINLRAQGVADSDISLMLMSDFGLDLYGNVIIVNPDFAKAEPQAVRGFLRAAVKGYQNTIGNPAEAVKFVLAHNAEADEEQELNRLIMAIGHHIVTPEVREHGLGNLQLNRLEKSIEQISQSYDFTNRPTGSEIFDSSYLPEASTRKPEPVPDQDKLDLVEDTNG